MKNFTEMFNLKNLINEPTCYKNAKNPPSIDVMLTNRKSSFQTSLAIETEVLKRYVKEKLLSLLTIGITKTSMKPISDTILSDNSNLYINYEDFKDTILSDNSNPYINYEDFRYDLI